jgi:hypothetical protein
MIYTPESIISEKKKKMNGGTGMNTKTALEVINGAIEKSADTELSSEIAAEEKTAFDIVNEAFEKNAAIEQEYLEKQANSFTDVLLGNNVKAVDKMIEAERASRGGFNQTKNVINTAGGIGHFVGNTADTFGDNLKNLAKRNKLTQLNEDGTISVLDRSRKHFQDTKQLKSDISNARNKLDASNKDVENKGKSLTEHVKKNYRKEDVGPNAVVDTLLKPFYDRRAKQNEVVDSLVSKMKNGEELNRDEIRQLLRSNSKLAKDYRTGKLQPLGDLKKAKGEAGKANSELRGLEDEKELRNNKLKIEAYNTAKKTGEAAKDLSGKSNATANDFKDTFDVTVNGKEPNEGLQALKEKEQAKTLGARVLTGGAAVAGGMALGNKTNNNQAQQPQQGVNPYNAQRRERRDYVNKVASEILGLALEK